jgi:hypothetical protein
MLKIIKLPFNILKKESKELMLKLLAELTILENGLY